MHTHGETSIGDGGTHVVRPRVRTRVDIASERRARDRAVSSTGFLIRLKRWRRGSSAAASIIPSPRRHRGRSTVLQQECQLENIPGGFHIEPVFLPTHLPRQGKVHSYTRLHLFSKIFIVESMFGGVHEILRFLLI